MISQIFIDWSKEREGIKMKGLITIAQWINMYYVNISKVCKLYNYNNQTTTRFMASIKDTVYFRPHDPLLFVTQPAKINRMSTNCNKLYFD